MRASKTGKHKFIGLHRDTIGNEVQVRQRTASGRLRGDEIEVLVVAFDPVEGRARRWILAVAGREIAGSDPEGDFGMARHHTIERIEIAV